MSKPGAFIAFLLPLGIGFASAFFLLKSGYFSEPVGVAVLADGGTYTGELEDGRLEGRGSVSWPEGGAYDGEFKGGLFHGNGDYTDMLGTRYVGTFEQGTFSGQGKIYAEGGGVYEGQTAGWRMHGQGEYRIGSQVYRGNFDQDAFSGKGELSEEDELIYRGVFENWLYHGEGEYFDTDGQWQGSFEQGALVKGSFTSELGDHYEGEVRYQQFHGDGILRLANGDRYEGRFRYGQYHGKGTMYLAEAQGGITEYGGVWRKGRLVTSEQSTFVENYEADLEQALYSEAALLESVLKRVPAGDPSRAEIYFLGIAGDGTQRVFTREVTAIRNYFDSLVPLHKRQVNLLNDRSMIGQQPMATLTSIERAIDTIGQQMNSEQDLLLMYISSHGSQDHHISLNNEALSIADLSAEHLSKLLKKSGILWQVIFVSACYAGGFIEPLQSDSTLIMTAAASDKTSFGCSDKAEVTYFGQALLESLSQAADPQTAFNILQKLIEEREAVEDLTSSDPQLYLGKAMAEKLKGVGGVFSG